MSLHPPMTSLDLRGSRITDEGLFALASWPHLHRLRLSGNDDITDEGVAEFVYRLGTSLQVSVRAEWVLGLVRVGLRG